MPKYGAGLHFIQSTPGDRLVRATRRTARSHVAKAQKCKPPAVAPRPSMIPSRVGSDFSTLQLPQAVEPHMVGELVALVNLVDHGVYPYEICLRTHPAERGWFPYMISDICCLHSMLFASKRYLGGLESFHTANLHYAKTLQLLQARLDAYSRGSFISDTTMMVIITLGAAAEMTGDLEAATNHIGGLAKIVALRGGVRSLDLFKNMQFKVCRADISLALRTGHRPLLFEENQIVWEPFFIGEAQCQHDALVDGPVNDLVRRLDPRLQNLWKDLHAFSCLSNLAFQTTRRMSPEIYNEAMVSIFYRLLMLALPDCHDHIISQCVRTGLLVYASTIFMQRSVAHQPNIRLMNDLHNVLWRLHQSSSSSEVTAPPGMILWMILVWHAALRHSCATDDWLSKWLDDVILELGIKSWSEARDVLRSIMWVGFIHDSAGCLLVDESVSRITSGI